jgi:hypothetical protein
MKDDKDHKSPISYRLKVIISINLFTKKLKIEKTKDQKEVGQTPITVLDV